MATKKKNVETEVIEKEVKKRTSRKIATKNTENTNKSPSAASESEFVCNLTNSDAKTNVAAQANPGRFTAEMLIEMGEQMKGGNAENCETVMIEEKVERLNESAAAEEEELVFVQSFEKPHVKDAKDNEPYDDVVGKEFEYRGMSFIVLEELKGAVLAISSDILEKRMRFAENAEKGSNDWKKSSLRKKLNSEHLQKFNKNDLMPIVSDLTADTGEDKYGKCEDYIAIPSDNMFRKFHKIIPAYSSWVWSLTPWAIEYGTISAVGARTSAKTIYSEQVNHELGVAIVCKFKKDVICWQ